MLRNIYWVFDNMKVVIKSYVYWNVLVDEILSAFALNLVLLFINLFTVENFLIGVTSGILSSILHTM